MKQEIRDKKNPLIATTTIKGTKYKQRLTHLTKKLYDMFEFSQSFFIPILHILYEFKNILCFKRAAQRMEVVL